MKLSLIIPYYNTPAELVDRLFKSINEQKNFNFNELQILFVDDCSPIKYDFDSLAKCDNLANEKISIVNLKENAGAGVARQYGLHYALGDYVIFADADDKFRLTHIEDGKEYGVFEFFLKLIDAHPNMNIIRTSWLEEQFNKDTNKILCVPHLAQLDNTWLHGKLYKRQFLVDNNIQFHKSLRKQEDTYFNSLASEIAKDTVVAYNGLLSYCWCDDNKNSLTRNNNNEYSYNAMCEFVDAIDYAVEYLIKLDINVLDKIISNIIYIYFILQSASWRDKSKKQYYNALRKRIAQFEHKYRDVWNYINTNNSHFAEMYIGRYSIQFESEKFIPKETFDDFLKSIRKII